MLVAQRPSAPSAEHKAIVLNDVLETDKVVGLQVPLNVRTEVALVANAAIEVGVAVVLNESTFGGALPGGETSVHGSIDGWFLVVVVCR